MQVYGLGWQVTFQTKGRLSQYIYNVENIVRPL